MNPPRILIVDDDPTVTRILVRIFERSGFQTATAPNGKQALIVLTDTADHPFDAMVCDIQMPHMNGRELMRHLAEHGPYMPQCAFIVTSRSEDEERCWVKDYPAISVVEKPVSPKHILRLVRQRLDDLDETERRAA